MWDFTSNLVSPGDRLDTERRGTTSLGTVRRVPLEVTRDRSDSQGLLKRTKQREKKCCDI